jgi:uncharacterized membrane protein YozB (DUF420 family)
MYELLPHVNATLNACAAVLLLAGYVLIKAGEEKAHKWAMVAAFNVSILFLACYVVYHLNVGSKRFPSDVAPWIRAVYLSILASHVVLAATVPFLAVATLYYGFRDLRGHHIRVARWTFPIWMYVSITGVIVYVMLYHVWK